MRAIAGFVWPCVTSNLNVVDLQEKYTGLQVLAYLIARFYPIMSKAAPQVFLCLAKGPQTEVKKMVNPSLDLLLPAWVAGPEEQVSAREIHARRLLATPIPAARSD